MAFEHATVNPVSFITKPQVVSVMQLAHDKSNIKAVEAWLVSRRFIVHIDVPYHAMTVEGEDIYFVEPGDVIVLDSEGAFDTWEEDAFKMYHSEP